MFRSDPTAARLVAPPSVPPQAWAAALPPSRCPLVLAPGSVAGWFSGRALVACDPVLSVDIPSSSPGEPYRPRWSLSLVGSLLERAFGAGESTVAAALVSYEGTVSAALFPRGMTLGHDGWRTWGDWHGVEQPQPAEVEVPASAVPLIGGAWSTLTEEEYRQRVAEAQEMVLRGDLCMLNLTRAIRGRSLADAPTLFAALCDRARADMAAFWALRGQTLVSVSSERFLRVRGCAEDGPPGTQVEVMPVKGTRPRGPTTEGDLLFAEELAASEKERAEHVMVVDMERNDLGRVCETGSVHVAPLMEVQATPYCHQMVSVVRGRLERKATFAHLLAAAFPCGSVTGAPKPAAMRAIARLEGAPRGAYTGSLLVAAPGRVDSSVLIRTAVADDGGGLSWGTGCGVTIDSDPAEEWLESELKASPLMGRRAG